MRIYFSFTAALALIFELFSILNNNFDIDYLLQKKAGLFLIILIILYIILFYYLFPLLTKSNPVDKIFSFKKFKSKNKAKKGEWQVIKPEEQKEKSFFLEKIAKIIKEQNNKIKIKKNAEKLELFLISIVNNLIPNKVIEQFIKTSISEGLPLEQIQAKLKSAGYSEKKINSVLLSLDEKIESEKHKRINENYSIIPEEELIINSKKEEEKEKSNKTTNTKMIDLIRLALRIFKVKPTRTILTILGIGVSFGVILFLVSLGYGLQNHLLRQISSNEALLTLDVFSPNPDVLSINNEKIKKFSSMLNIQKVNPVAVLPGQININGISFEVLFTGVDPSFKDSGALNILQGDFLKSGEKEEAVFSSFFINLLNEKPENLTSKEISLIFFIPDSSGTVNTVKEEKKFKIVGITEDETNNFVYIPFSFLEKFNLPSYGSVKIKVSDTDYLEETRSKILEEGFSVSTISDTVEQANKIFKALQIILALFGIAALIVAVIGMINTMTIALLERIQEIGIMKVIGASDKDIERLFLLESLVIGFLGGISGLFLGFISSQMFNIGINILAKTLGGSEVNLFYYPIWFIAAIIIFASFVGVLTGVIPAKKAGKMDPLQALRYK